MILSVMITTKNRAMDLERTFRVLPELNPVPLKILITADGCADDMLFVHIRSLPPTNRLAVRCRVALANALFIARGVII
jgi:hypothetical protein